MTKPKAQTCKFIELRELINHLCIVVPADEQQLNNIHELTKNVSLDDEE